MRTKGKVILAVGIGVLGAAAAVALLARRFQLVVMNGDELMSLVTEHGRPYPSTVDESNLGRYAQLAGWPVQGVGLDFQTSAEEVATVSMPVRSGIATLQLVKGDNGDTFQLVSYRVPGSLEGKALPETFKVPGLKYAHFLVFLTEPNGEA